MNQESLNNENVNNSVQQPVQPTYTTPVMDQPQVTPVQQNNVQQPVQPTYTTPVIDQPQVTPVQQDVVENKESIEKVSNLNKEDAMEEALSHTNQYPPFEVQQEEVNQETSIMSNKKALIFLGIILGIMLLFIIFLPQISKLIG